MGQTLNSHFTRVQQRFLHEVRGEPYLLQTFYLTGGTALAACYLNHRLSQDIDLFTFNMFDHTRVIDIMKTITIHRLRGTASFVRIHDSLQYTISIPRMGKLKVDFVPYHFKQLGPPHDLNGLKIDSIEDIAVNKLLAISQRTASKDYVDLYMLLKRFTFWDLRIGVEHKFGMEIEPFYIASLLKNVDALTELPIMKKTLTLEQLKKFFLKEAKRLAAPLVKP